MIATAAANPHFIAPGGEFEHLLLGDLRELLSDAVCRDRDRWLLATLDMLLVSRPRSGPQVYLPVLPREQDLGVAPLPRLPLAISSERLQRLRDRIAHRAPFEAEAKALMTELNRYFQRPAVR